MGTSQKLDELKHFCFFETKSLGTSYKLSQLLSATLPHKIFEASVTPSGSILVIAFEKEVQASQINLWVKSDSEISSAVKSWHMSLNTNSELIDGYLNQIMRPINGRLVIVEGHLFASVFPVIESLLSEGLKIIEFRLIRSHQNRFCVSFSANLETHDLEQKISQAMDLIKNPSLQAAIQVSLIHSPSEEIKNQYAF